MLFVSIDDFFQKSLSSHRLSKEDEKACVIKMSEGDTTARQDIVNSYLPLVASYVRRYPKEVQTLEMIYRCISTLEKGVDSFNFLQDNETFIHHMSWRLRQCITRYIADRY